MITIGVSSWFKRYTGGLSSLEQELHEGETAWEAVVRAGIPREEIGFITVRAEGQTGVAPHQTDGLPDQASGAQNQLRYEMGQQPDVEKRVDDSYVVAGGDALKVYPMIIGG